MSDYWQSPSPKAGVCRPNPSNLMPSQLLPFLCMLQIYNYAIQIQKLLNFFKNINLKYLYLLVMMVDMVCDDGGDWYYSH